MKNNFEKSVADDSTENMKSNLAKFMAKDSTKNQNAVALGKLGGRARAKALTKEQRMRQAKLAANARWNKVRATEKIEAVLK